MQKTPLSKRINTVRGQLSAINDMLESGEDCVAILTQLKAAKAGISRTITLFVEENLRQCMLKNNNEKSSVSIETLLKELTK